MSRISKCLSAALLLVAATAFASREDRFQLEYNKDFSFRGGRVSVENSFGGIRIDTDTGSEIHVRATIRASDPEYGKQIRVIAEPGGGGFSIRTEYPGNAIHMHNSSFSVDYRITVPKSAQLDVKNKFGSIEASGFAGSSSFVNSYGSIRLRDGNGNQRIENSFGSIDLSGVIGAANVSNKYGSIRAHDVSGDLALNNGFGSLDIENVQGNIDIATQNGSVHVRHVGGRARVSSSFGSVTATDVTGDADIRNQNGRIEVSEVGGNAILKTSFASVQAERVGGRAEVDNANGSVQLSDIGSDAIVRTSFASVFARGVKGAIDIQDQNGAISVSQTGPACKPISLHTSFSSIRVVVPSNASYSVNARTSFGRISSALPITTRTMSEDTLVGTIGGGACSMELVNSNGAITIEKE